MTAPSPEPPAEPVTSILLVDDTPANLLALESALGGLGLDLVNASSGEEALRLLLRRDFAVVLLDLFMQGMDGFETARLIRSRERSRHLPIIFLTARDPSAFPVAEAYALGAVDYLVKPVAPEVLRAKVSVFADLARKTETVRRQAELLRRAERERSERRATVAYVVAGLLADAGDPGQGVPKALRAVGETLGWDAGGLWAVERPGPALRLAAFWRGPGVAGDAFEEASRSRTLGPGEGLPGRVWSSGEPARVEDVTSDPNFPRAPQATAAGLRGACALPVRVAGEVVGVLEFFSRQAQPRDDDLLRAMAGVGSQVGQFLERQRAKEELREQRELFRTMADSIPQLAWMARPDGHIFWYNKRWYDYTGSAPEQMEGSGWQSVHDPAELPRVLEGFKAAIAEGRPWEDTFPLRRHDGAMRWHLSRATPLRDVGDRVVRWFGTNTDVTELREMEEALRRARDQLEERVRERTAELAAANRALSVEVEERKEAEERVRAFAAELQRSNQELEQFASVASHDLQEPLRKIQAFGDRLHAKFGADLGEQGRDYLGRMRSAAARMSTLISDLLAFSRVTTRAQPFAPVDLAAEVGEVVSDLEARLQQTGGRVDVGPLPELSADPTQVRQLFQNLIGNALKFHRPDEPPVVKVRGRVLPGADGRDGEVCEVTVEDNGIGFEEKYLDRIFQLFQRLHGRNEYEGTGIGLAICRKIVERHGGGITARSAPGRGSTFTVTLPRNPAPEERTL